MLMHNEEKFIDFVVKRCTIEQHVARRVYQR